MRDKTYDTERERTYECYECGETLETSDPPGECPECGGEMRNYKIPLE